MVSDTLLHHWQAIDRSQRCKKKRTITVLKSGRGAGKSMFMQMHFSGSWSKWEKTFVWPWDKKESVEGKKIWGKMNTRTNALALNGDGSRIIQFATDKEIFKRKLQGIGESW